MNIIDIVIPLVPGILLVAFPNILTPKTASPEETAKKTKLFRKIGYMFLGAATLYLVARFASK
jgi:hypothetical protein